MSWSAGSLAAVAACGVALAAAQEAPAPQMTFRTGVDLVQLDVSVLDNDRRPVQGLTVKDFTVRIDGRQMPIAVFKAVALPPPAPPPTAAWITDVAPDVATNTRSSGRVIAILIDDYSFSEAAIELAGVRKARETAFGVVDALGPDDRAAVLFTGYGRTAQTFTSDRALLRAAIDKAPLFGSDLTPGESSARGFCYCGMCSIDALGRIAESLRSLPEQRKILVYVSAGSYLEVPRWNPGKVDECIQRKRDAAHEALRQAHLANVTIQAIDPKGLVPTSGRGPGRRGAFGEPLPSAPLDDRQTLRLEFLRTVAETTGGRAIVNDNDMNLRVPGVLAESGSYYLLGVERPASREPGQPHPVEVRVNRRGVDVRTRRGYYDPTRREVESMAAMAESRDPTLAIVGAMPKSDVPLDLAVAPFAVTRDEAALALVLGVSPRAGAGGALLPRGGEVEVLAQLFNPETGQSRGVSRQRVAVTRKAGGPASYYEVLSRVSATTGRHELRVGVLADDGRTASVYASVEVPDVGSGLSVSGLVIGMEPSVAAGPPGAFDGLLPIPPTARRVFRPSDRVTAFLRVYQNAAPFARASVTARVTDASNKIVLEQRDELAGAPAAFGSAADHRVEVPVQRLPTGEYLLTMDVEGRNTTVRRAARFRIE